MAKQTVRSIKDEIRSIEHSKLPLARAVLSKLITARKALMPHGENSEVRSLIQSIDNGEVREKDVIPTRNYPYLPVDIDLEGWDGKSLSTYRLDVEILEAKLESLINTLPSESDIASAQAQIDTIVNDLSPIASEYEATHHVLISYLQYVVSLLNDQAGRRSKLVTANDKLTYLSESVDIPVNLFPVDKDSATRDMTNALRTAIHSNLGGGSVLSSDTITRATTQYVNAHGPIKVLSVRGGEEKREKGDMV